MGQNSMKGSEIDRVLGWVKQAAKGVKMKAKIFFLTMAVVLVFSLVVVPTAVAQEPTPTPEYNPHYIYTPSSTSLSVIAGGPVGDSFDLTVSLSFSPPAGWWVDTKMLVVDSEDPFTFVFVPTSFILNENNPFQVVHVTVTSPEGTIGDTRTIKATGVDGSGSPSVGQGSGCTVSITVEAPTPTPTEVDLGIAVVVFKDITQGGDTTATTIGTTPCGPIPAGYTVVGSFVDITTTVIYNGVVTGVIYDESQVDNEANLRLFHCAGGQWEDITTYVDVVNDIVYGRPESLSVFAAGEPVAAAGCFIATAAYGTPTAEQIDVLRAFRDQVLMESSLGSQFVSLYYDFSPPLAEFISEHSLLRALVRELVIEPIVSLAEITQGIWGD